MKAQYHGIRTSDLDINCELWLSRLTSPNVPLKRDGVGQEYHYHTTRDLHTRQEFRDLTNAILACLPEGCELIDLWANLLTRGNYRTLHDHVRPETSVTLSGVLYLTDGSALTFPRTSPLISVAPRPGLLVVFPPSALHRVEPSYAVERWSLGFNARRTAREVPV